MTIAEAKRIEQPALPGTKPTRTVDLTKPAPAGATLPEVESFFADLKLDPDAMAQLTRSLPDTLRWAQRIENARAAGDEDRAKVPTVKTILGWINAARAVSLGDPEPLANIPYGLEFRAIWSVYRSARGLTLKDMEASYDHAPTNAFALRMAEYTRQSLTAWLEIRQAQRDARAEKAGAVEKARAELLAVRFKDSLPQLERFADALAAAGRTAEAGEVRRVGAAVLRRLIEGDTFHRLVRD
jgi:hypothetical protein